MGTDRRAGPADPGYWNGTLLKCPGCRLKFPFSAAEHPFELRRKSPAGGASRSDKVGADKVRVTRCPQCQGWVNII